MLTFIIYNVEIKIKIKIKIQKLTCMKNRFLCKMVYSQFFLTITNLTFLASYSEYTLTIYLKYTEFTLIALFIYSIFSDVWRIYWLARIKSWKRILSFNTISLLYYFLFLMKKKCVSHDQMSSWSWSIAFFKLVEWFIHSERGNHPHTHVFISVQNHKKKNFLIDILRPEHDAYDPHIMEWYKIKNKELRSAVTI